MSRRLLTLLAASLFTVPSFSYAVNGNPGGIRSNESINRTQQPVSPHKNNQAKMRIAPHTVTIQTELQTAIDEVKGLKAQLEAIPDQKPGPTVIEHLRMHSKELNSRVKMTATHEQHLKTAAGEFPMLAQNEQFKSAQTAIQQAEKANQDWQQKSKQSAYWTNTTQALNDLNTLEEQFENAFEKSKELNSQYDIKSFG